MALAHIVRGVVVCVALFGAAMSMQVCVIAGSPTGATGQADPSSAATTIGPKTFVSARYTSDGTAVVPMWNASTPGRNGHGGAGLATVAGAQHATVWAPDHAEEGTYNHYASLVHYRGRFFAMWGNHTLAEDAGGQRVLYAYADLWNKWTRPQVLFPAPGPVMPRGKKGIHLKPDRWAVVDGNLYAIVYVHGAGMYPIARSVATDGKLGTPFLLFSLPVEAELPEFMTGRMNSIRVPPEATKIKNWYWLNNHIPWWASGDWGVQRRGIDGTTLIESFSYRARDGIRVLMMRNWGTPRNPVHNNRVYVSFRTQGKQWAPLHPTDIPDSPSRSEAVTLEDGTVLLVGNHIAYTLDEGLYLDRVPLTISVSKDGYAFERSLALRAGHPAKARFPEVRGRNPGYSYPSSIVLEDWLYTLYSVNKEDMVITKAPLDSVVMRTGAAIPTPKPKGHAGRSSERLQQPVHND